jgi:hypothetical protein
VGVTIGDYLGAIVVEDLPEGLHIRIWDVVACGIERVMEVGFSLLAVLDCVADEHPALCARVGAQALEAGVVRFHSVVVSLSGWVQVGYADPASLTPEE